MLIIVSLPHYIGHEHLSKDHDVQIMKSLVSSIIPKGKYPTSYICS